jgi:hypothetical protein
MAQTWQVGAASAISPGDAANADSAAPRVSGAFVAFNSAADNLVANQNDAGETDVFLLDRGSGAMRLVSHAAADPLLSSAPGFSQVQALVGNTVLFDSTAPHLIAGQTAGFTPNVFVHQYGTNTNRLVSHAAGAPSMRSNGECHGRALDVNARFVVLACTSTDLIAGISDTNNQYDLFLWDPTDDSMRLITHAGNNANQTANAGVDAFSGAVQISLLKRYVAFTSPATNLVVGQNDTNNAEDVFFYDMQSGEIRLASRIAASATSTGAAGSTLVGVDDGAGAVIFNSTNANLIAGAGDTNNASDVYRYDIASGTVSLVTHVPGAPTTAGNGASIAVAMGSSSRRLLIETTASNLISNLTGALTRDVVLWIGESDFFRLVSHATGNEAARANAPARALSISGNGTYAAFETTATNIVAGFSAALTNASNAYIYNAIDTSNVLATHRHGFNTVGTARAGEWSSLAFDGSDGNSAVLATLAGDLSPSTDGNALADVYVYDRASNTWALVSRAAFPRTASANRATTPVDISADGRYVLESSNATNLAFDQIEIENDADVFVHDTVTGTHSLVNVAIEGFEVLSNVPGNAPAQAKAISRDGNWILFSSAATNVIGLPTDTNNAIDVFVANRTGGTAMVSHNTTSHAASGNAAATPIAISADGHYVLFESAASNLAVGITDNNAATDVFLYDRIEGTNTLVSKTSGAATSANGTSRGVAMSADGRFVLYYSTATNLIPSFVNGNGAGDDVFLFDRTTGTSILASRTAGTPNAGANGASNAVALSDDGDIVVFNTSATNIISGVTDTNAAQDVYLFRRSTATFSLISRSRTSATQAANGSSSARVLSGDGNHVIFQSFASDVVAGFVDGNDAATFDLYWFDRAAGTNTLFSRSSSSATTSSNRSWDSVSVNADGSRAVFDTLASDVVAGINTGAFWRQVYQYRRSDTSFSLVSHRAGDSLEGNRNSLGARQSGTGDRVAFASEATDLANWVDRNAAVDAFVADRINGFVVTPVIVGNGVSNPAGPQIVPAGGTTAFTLSPGVGQRLASAGGCNGSLVGNVYTTGAVFAHCSVTFQFEPQQFTLRYLSGPHGSLTGNTTQIVNYGGSGTAVNVQPDVGYQFSQWSDGNLALSRIDSNVTADITVTAQFELRRLTLLYSAGAGGTINGQAQQLFTIDYGTNGPTVTAQPNAGFIFTQWSDGVLTAQRTDLNVIDHINVQAQFAENTNFTITPVIGAHGNANPNTPQTVAAGGTVFFDLTPDTGYRIGSVGGCGGALAGNRYTIAPATQNCNVNISFNRTPVAQNGSLAAMEDGGSFGGVLSANDDDAFTVILVTPPTKGNVVVQQNLNFFYAPNADANGLDSFTFKINDGVQDSNLATVTIDIAAVNDRPSFTLNPAIIPEHAAGSSGVQTRNGVLANVDFGPPDEDATQSIASASAIEFFDPTNVISAVAVNNAGVLTYTLTGNPGLARVNVFIVDSGGTTNGGVAISEPRELNISVQNGTDLQISNTNGTASVTPGQALVYEVLAANAGPYAATGASLNIPVPAGFGNVLWRCDSIQLANCPQANGAGAINNLALDLPMNGVLRFLITGNATGAVGSTIQHTASIALPAPMVELNAANNTASDIDPIVAPADPLFRDGFESSSTHITVPFPRDALLYRD